MVGHSHPRRVKGWPPVYGIGSPSAVARATAWLPTPLRSRSASLATRGDMALVGHRSGEYESKRSWRGSPPAVYSERAGPSPPWRLPTVGGPEIENLAPRAVTQGFA